MGKNPLDGCIMKWNMDTFLVGHTIPPTGGIHRIFQQEAIPQMVEEKVLIELSAKEAKNHCDHYS